jgi:GNAT superfamily N-acetyltransferase
MSANLVRPAQLSDVTTLATMMIEFYAEADFTLSREAAQRTFEQLIRWPERGCVWILECDAGVAGFIVLTFAYAMEYGGQRGFVDDLFVRRSFRKRGLGTAAIAVVKAHCLATGVRALFVQTGSDNGPAGRVYKRAGFTDTGHQLLVQPLQSPIHVKRLPPAATSAAARASRR